VKALEIGHNIEFGTAAHVDLSVLAVYYLARGLQFPPLTNIDDGTMISCACDAVRRFGVPPESEWPFDVSKINTPPSWAAMRRAYVNKITSFYRIKGTGSERVDMVAKAIRAKYPVVYGTIIGSNWMKYKAGQVLTVTPDKDEIGRHATVLLGIQDGNFIGENSWGSGWGENGFYLASPDMIASSKAGDFWVLGR
jgi:C1A family cysteine protease